LFWPACSLRLKSTRPRMDRSRTCCFPCPLIMPGLHVITLFSPTAQGRNFPSTSYFRLTRVKPFIVSTLQCWFFKVTTEGLLVCLESSSHSDPFQQQLNLSVFLTLLPAPITALSILPLINIFSLLCFLLASDTDRHVAHVSFTRFVQFAFHRFFCVAPR
jgi:hypothetical protein